MGERADAAWANPYASEHLVRLELGEAAFALAAHAGVFAVGALVSRGRAVSGFAFGRGAHGAADALITEVGDQLGVCVGGGLDNLVGAGADAATSVLSMWLVSGLGGIWKAGDLRKVGQIYRIPGLADTGDTSSS